MLIVEKPEDLHEFLLEESPRDPKPMSLAKFQKLLQMVIEAPAEEEPGVYGHVACQAREGGRIIQVPLAGIMPIEVLHVEDQVMSILRGGDFKRSHGADRHLDWRLVGNRWAIHAPEKMEDGRWNSAAVPATFGRPVKDEEIIWTSGYPSASYAYLGTCCAALEAEAQRGEPLADFEAFATGIRKASPEQLAEGLNKLPDALVGATSVIAPILKDPQMAKVVELQAMLLGERWRVHGIVQGHAMDEWRCTMISNEAGAMRARSGKSSDPVIAFLLAVLRARLIDKGLLRTDRPEAA